MPNLLLQKPAVYRCIYLASASSDSLPLLGMLRVPTQPLSADSLRQFLTMAGLELEIENVPFPCLGGAIRGFFCGHP